MVFDCFTFFNELDVLEIRLEELKGVVDYFVLLEAGETFTGKPKPFVFDQNKNRFSAYPICHIMLPRFPPHLATAWDREGYSRDQLLTGLERLKARPSDIVMISDVDEIPPSGVVWEHARALSRGSRGTPLVYSQSMYYYYVNCLTDQPWYSTRMTRLGEVSSLQSLRKSPGMVVPGAGWHFSYLGGPARIREKIEAFSHTEYDLPQYKDRDHLHRCLREGVDLFGRESTLQFVPQDDTFPRHLFQNQDRFSHLIYR